VAPVAAHEQPVGVVIVNWNGHEDTVDCLESLLGAEPRPARVAVVDNGSTDGSVARLRGWAADRGVGIEAVDADLAGSAPSAPDASPWLSLVVSTTNRGFSGGNNVGLRHLARCERLRHFLLLNNDAAVAPDFFAEMAAAVDGVPEVGLATGTIYEWGDRSRVWYAGGSVDGVRGLGVHDTRRPAADLPRETEFVCGCAMLIPRRTLERVGPLPECYHPGYFEDAEYSLRVRAAGMTALYAPRAVVYHKVGSSFLRASPRPGLLYVQTRNRAYFVRRNLRGWRRWAALTYLVVTKPGRAAVETLRGHPRLGWAILSGAVAGLVGRAARP
jgi:GT2 family glycosyltransferase